MPRRRIASWNRAKPSAQRCSQSSYASCEPPKIIRSRQPLKIAVHLPETEASALEALDLGEATTRYLIIAPESSRLVLTNSPASVAERWLCRGKNCNQLACAPHMRILASMSWSCQQETIQC